MLPGLSGCLQIGFKRETLRQVFKSKNLKVTRLCQKFEHVENEKKRKAEPDWSSIEIFSDESTWFGGREKQENSPRTHVSLPEPGKSKCLIFFFSPKKYLSQRKLFFKRRSVKLLRSVRAVKGAQEMLGCLRPPSPPFYFVSSLSPLCTFQFVEALPPSLSLSPTSHLSVSVCVWIRA